MLNCLYDCRYCFLQGMFSSANYVFFVNFEDFEASIDVAIEEAEGAGESACFFSGYDCDSLAMENLTGFTEAFLPFFTERPRAWLELRTKSVNVTPLLNRPEALANVVVAFSVSPPEVAQSIEHGAPPVGRRIDALAKLAARGWPIGLRIDPLIAAPDFESGYRKLIGSIFDRVSAESIHSVTVGPMRFPQAMLDRITRLYPEEPLFAANFERRRDGLVSYPEEVEAGMRAFVIDQLRERLPAERIFDCVEPVAVAGAAS
jgi:spore photoproduct lyase